MSCICTYNYKNKSFDILLFRVISVHVAVAPAKANRKSRPSGKQMDLYNGDYGNTRRNLVDHVNTVFIYRCDVEYIQLNEMYVFLWHVFIVSVGNFRRASQLARSDQ